MSGRLALLLLLIALVLWVRRWLRARVEGAGESAAGAGDPYAILGVGRDASPEEVARAYREQMKRYHPDRVAGLGEELQRVAHRKTLEIQRAYDAIGRR